MMVEKPEGELARVKSVVVSETSLASIAIDLKIDTLLILGKGEESSGGRKKKTLLADAMEALIGAYYLDSGYAAVFDFVSRHLCKQIELVLENKHKKDYKTLLQEFCQQQFRVYPVYSLVKKTGPDHDRLFWIEVNVQGTMYGPGFGKNKKEAEQEAARLAWDTLNPAIDSPVSVPFQ
jgi:ribonuclease-3